MNKKNYPLVFGAIGILTVLALFLIKGQNNSQVSTPVQSPLSTPLISPTPSASPNLKTLNLRLFFVALNDDGKNGEKIGCGDSIAPVNIQVPETETPLQAVMLELLSIKQQTVGPSKLYNSLYQSKLEFKDAEIKNGVATIHLTGNVQLAGECDNPRFQSQLTKTAAQFSNINSVQIFINDKPLSEVVSLK